MDPMGEEQLDYGDDDFTGSNPNPHHHHHHHQTAAAIPALAEDEMLGDDDEYDDLYNDVNVGENFMQHTSSNLHQNQVNKNPNRNPNPSPFGNDSGSVPAVARIESPRPPPVVPTPEQNPTFGTHISNSRASPQLPQDNDLGFQRGPPAPQMPVKVAVPPAPAPPVIRPAVGPVNVNGPTMLFVGELHWWTTDADLESVLTQFGRVKEIKFFDERASGKSKGYCQVEFFEAAAAAACKEGMDGYEFNGRSCVVAFASPQTLRQMGANYVNRSQGQGQGQGPQQHQGRRQMNDGPMGRGGGNGGGVGDGGGRGFGRGGWGGRGQGMMGRGQSGGGMMRGRGFAGGKGMMGPGSNNGGVGNNGPYGQGFAGPVGLGGAGGMMHPQNMMGAGFDPTYMGRGGPYGGFSAPAFTGMMNPFQAVNAVGLPGVAPHVNPAFFGRGMSANGMGVMGNSGMEGQMWGDASMGSGGWTGDELGRKTRESSYGGDDGASEYGYGEMNHERGGRSNLSREKERGSERDWSGNSERRHRDEREQDWDRSDRERHREEKDGYREYRSRDRDYDNEADWDKGQSSSRSRSRMMQEDDHRSRSRDTDYGKRRRIPSE